MMEIIHSPSTESAYVIEYMVIFGGIDIIESSRFQSVNSFEHTKLLESVK